MCVCIVYIYYVYINTQTHYIFRKYLHICIYIHIIYIIYKYIKKYKHTLFFLTYIHACGVYLYIPNKHTQYTHILCKHFF